MSRHPTAVDPVGAVQEFVVHRRAGGEDRLGVLVGGVDGVHKCLGRNLVRLECAILARTLLAAFPKLEVISDPKWILDVQGSRLSSLVVRNAGV